MRIVIAGTVHQDPLCRRALREMFVTLVASELPAPRFVAVEADPNQFAQIKILRESFKLEASAAWPEMSGDVIEELALTWLFEADTYLGFYPDVDVVWMDRGRPLPKGVVSLSSHLHLDSYQPWIEKRRASGAGFETSSVLHYLSSAAKLGVRNEPPCRDPARDARWYTEMLPYLDRAIDGDWGLVVCGAEHGLNENGNIAELLQLSGHAVEFEDLVRAVS